jgi:hypothetical protein
LFPFHIPPRQQTFINLSLLGGKRVMILEEDISLENLEAGTDDDLDKDREGMTEGSAEEGEERNT